MLLSTIKKFVAFLLLFALLLIFLYWGVLSVSKMKPVIARKTSSMSDDTKRSLPPAVLAMTTLACALTKSKNILPEENPVTFEPALESKLMGIVAKERRSALEHGCRNIHSEKALSVDQIMNLPDMKKPRLYFSNKYKVLLCEVPKCGSTSWKKALLSMEGDVKETDPNKISGGSAHEAGKKRYLWAYYNASDPASVANTRKRIASYTRVMTVREPIERLVSAYKDKMLPTGSGGSSYAALSNRIHNKFINQNTTEPKTALNSTTTDALAHATWEEFVRYLLDPNRGIYMDAHWEKYSLMCYPCSIKYDYVAKLETIFHDIKYLSRQLGYDMTPYFPLSKEANKHLKWETEYVSYFLKLSKKQRHQLYDMYFDQYHLFGYPKPNFI